MFKTSPTIKYLLDLITQINLTRLSIELKIMKKLFNNSNHHLILQNTKKLEIKHIRNHKKLFELSFHTSKTAKTQKKKYAT